MIVQTKKQCSIQMKVIMVLMIMVALIAARWLYQQHIHQQNEARGYCTEADKVLSEAEMRRRIMKSYIKETVERNIETTSANHEISFYISKYNLNSGEKIIKTMLNSKSNQSFEENFGVVAAAYMSEYRDVLNARPIKLQAPQTIYRLVNRHAEVDRRYLEHLSGHYSFIYQSGDGATIMPESLIRRIDSKTYSIAFFSLDVACCDVDYIQKELQRYKNREYLLMERGEPINYTEPKISVDDIDGSAIDGVFFSKAYNEIILKNNEQIRNRYIYSNTANLRSVLVGYPMLQKRTVTACGDLQPLERKLSAKQIDQDIFKWLRKLHLKLTTSP